jgi:hypothetical protein
VRARWQEWIIGLSIVALSVAGVYTLWGDDLRRVFHPDEPPALGETPTPSTVAPPAGPAAGPF